jgi:hypothetical protein
MKSDSNQSNSQQTENFWKRHPKFKRVALGLTALIGMHTCSQFIGDSAYYHNIPHTFANTSNSEFRVGEKATHAIGLTENQLERKHNIKITGGLTQTPITDFYAASIDFVLQTLKDENVPMRKALRKIVIIPDKISTNYSGMAGKFGVTYLTQANADTLYHEIAHLHSFTLPTQFWEKWNASRTKDVKYPRLGSLANDIERLFGKEDNGTFEVKSGFVTAYSQMTVDEDLAEFVEECYQKEPSFTKAKFEERELYQNRIDLLEEYGFINAERAHTCKHLVSLDSPQIFLELTQELLREVSPKILKYEQHYEASGFILAEVIHKDKKAKVSYFSGMGGTSLDVVINISNIKLSRVYIGNLSRITPWRLIGNDENQENTALTTFLEQKGFLQKWGEYYISTVPNEWDKLTKNTDILGFVPAEYNGGISPNLQFPQPEKVLIYKYRK